MQTTNTYFHDRVVLFLLSVNGFLTVMYLLLFFVQFEQSGNYIVQYRAGANIDEYKSGGATDILIFPLFAVLVFISQVYLSNKLHKIQRHAAWAVMFFSTITLVTIILSTWALFKLR